MSDYLLPEVLNEILTRLPVKTLLRCTSVCKSWYSLITSPYFITTHLNRTIHTNQIFVMYLIPDCRVFGKGQFSLHIDNETFDKLASQEFQFASSFRIIGSSNGLICLSNDDIDDYMETTMLLNPSIRKYLILPMPNITFNKYGPCQRTIGFGFDSGTNDYKVVRVLYLRPVGTRVLPWPMVELYEFSTGCWRNINAGDFKYVVNERDPQAFLNGVVHWTGYEEDGLPNLIVSFDMKNEVFGAMMVPYSLQQESGLCAAVFGDSLSLMQHKVSGNDYHCYIWVMEEYGKAKSWRKQFTIDLNKGPLQGPFGFRENGDALLATLHGNGVGELVSYDPKSKQIKNLGIRGYAYAFCTDTYAESLVLVKDSWDVLERRVCPCDAINRTCF